MRTIKELFMTEGRGKRVCSILTALAMTLSLFAGVGAASFAEEDVPGVSTEAVAETISEAAPESNAEPGSDAMPEMEVELVPEAAPKAEAVPKADIEETTGEEQAQPLNALQEIDVVKVNVTIPVAGGTDTTVVYSSADPDKYAVTAQAGKWHDPSGAPATSFINGNDYNALFTVTQKGGYQLTQHTKVLVNEKETGVYLVGGGESPAQQFDFVCRPRVYGEISVINLPGVPEVIVGAKATPYSYSSPDGTYQATGIWFVYDNQTRSYQPVDGSHTFTEGKNYKLNLDMIPNVGYVVGEECRLYINDEEQGNFSFNENGISIDPIYYGAGKEIMKVDVDEASIPKLAAGKKFTDKMINVKAPADSNYTLAGYWTDEDGNKSGTFTKGKAYYFNLVIYAKDGYCLAKNLEISIGDGFDWITSEAASAEYQIRQSLAQVIDQVTLKNLPKAKIGAAIPEGEIKISVPSGAKYTATAVWLDETRVFASGIFQKGKAYTLEVSIDPKDGYELSRPLIIIADGVKHKVGYNSYDGALFSKTTSFRKEIKKVQLTGLTEPKAGAMPDRQISIPEGAPYTVEEVKWTSGTGEWIEEEADGAFESGKAYQVRIALKPKDGYEFTGSTVVTLNGKEVRIHMWETGEIGITEEWSLEKVITNVKMNNVPTMKIGQKARSNVTIPKGAKYSIRWAGWSVWNDDSASWEPFEGTFERGKAYEFSFTVVPVEGYRFSEENTKVYVNGKKNSNTSVAMYYADYRAGHSVGMKVIDKVEFHVTEPKMGEHSSMDIIITTADGAKYGVGYSHWLRRTDGGITYSLEEGPWENDKYFQEGIDYGVALAFSADAGYVFSDELTAIVNGKLLEAEDFTYNDKNGSITVFFSDLLNRMDADGNDGKGDDDAAAPGEEDSETTNAGGTDTGDDADMLPWVILASASLMAAAGVMSRRKVS